MLIINVESYLIQRVNFLPLFSLDIQFLKKWDNFLYKLDENKAAYSISRAWSNKSLNFIWQQEYTGIEDIHNKDQQVLMLTKPKSKTSVVRCQGMIFCVMSVILLKIFLITAKS